MNSTVNKAAFNRKFSQFVHRDYILTEEESGDRITEFISRHGRAIVKPVGGMKGKGIFVVSEPELNKDLLKTLAENPCVIEEIIRQHPKMAEPNPTSVNTVRIVTVLDKKGESHVIGACLRCGGAGSVVDNFHSGGIIYPVDVKLGIVVNKGKNNTTSESYLCHPSTGKLMLGFQIPYWEDVVECVKSAQKMLPALRYVGWDLAITESGVELVEANFGHDVSGVQYDHFGKKALVEKYFFTEQHLAAGKK